MISIVGIYLQVLFQDTVRNVFLESDKTTFGDICPDANSNTSEGIVGVMGRFWGGMTSCFRRKPADANNGPSKLKEV